MRVGTRDNCLSWARLAREHADAGLAALIAGALVLSLAAFDTAAREVAAFRARAARGTHSRIPTNFKSEKSQANLKNICIQVLTNTRDYTSFIYLLIS